MGSTWKRIAVLLVTVGAFGTPGAAAQTIPSPFEYLERRQEIGVWGGVLDAGTGRFGYGPSGGPTLGVRYGIELSGPLGFEGVVGVIDTERDVVDPSRAEDARIIGQSDMMLAAIDARLRFTFTGRRSWHGLSPFLTGGGGAVFGVAGDTDLDATLLPEDVFEFGTSFYGTLGLGTRWFLTDRFALRGDGQFSLWKIGTPPGFSDPTRGFENVEDGEWVSGTGFSLTLLWRW